MATQTPVRAEESIVLGDVVDLVGHRNRLYRAKIEDMLHNGLFLVGIPSFGGILMPLHANDDVFLVFYRETGRFVVQMSVVGFEKRGEIRYAWLYQKTEPYKDQRREAFRIPITLNVRVCEYLEETEAKLPEFGDIEDAIVLEDVSSRDISITGISILTKASYKSGERRLLKVYINGQSRDRAPFLTFATVARTTPWRESGKNSVGLSFFGHTRRMNEFISRYVLEEQRKQLRQRRLVEGK